MKAPIQYNRIQILAIAALATCAVALTWSASALARPIDDPALPAGVASSDPAQPTPYSGPHPGLSDFGVKAPTAVVGYHAALYVSVGAALLGLTAMLQRTSRRAAEPEPALEEIMDEAA